MCGTENLIHSRQTRLEDSYKGIHRRMKAHAKEGVEIPGENQIKAIFAGNTGIKLEYLGAFLRALDLKVSDYNSEEIDPETGAINRMIRKKYIEQDEEIDRLKKLIKANGGTWD